MRPTANRLTGIALAAAACALLTLPAAAGGSAVVITDVTKLEPAVAVGVVNLSLVPRTATVVVEVATKDGVSVQATKKVSVPPLSKVAAAVAFDTSVGEIQQVGIIEDPSPM